jgi:hypothetical protein
VGVLLLAGFCLLGLEIYLATPLPAAQLSRLLTSYLQQPLHVSGLHRGGGTLYLTGVTLANPADISPGNLLEADSIAIAPQWGEFLFGRRSFREITLSGIRLDLRKNSAGLWNFSRLQELFAGKKPSGAELLIGRLVVREGALRVSGQVVKGISLQLANLSSRGAGSAGIQLSFQDPARNRYTLSGKARPGPDPAIDLTLAAPEFSIANLAGLLQPKNRALPPGGRSNLQVKAALQKGQLQLKLSLNYIRLPLRIGQRSLPLTGSLTVAAAYDSSTDAARLESLRLTANDLISLHASGSAAALRGARRFAVAIAIDQFDLAVLNQLLPEVEARKSLIGGRLGGSEFRLTGNGKGLTAALGTLRLRDGTLERAGQLLIQGLDSNLKLTRVTAGFLARGRLTVQKPGGRALLEALEAPFALRISPRMELLAAEMPSLSATLMGLALDGRFGFQAAAPLPFTFALRIPSASFTALQPLLKKAGVRLTSGSGSLSLEGTGRGTGDFTATLNSRLATLQGGREGRRFGLKNAAAETRLVMSGGRLNLGGDATFNGLVTDAGGGQGSFSFRYGNGTAELLKGVMRGDALSASFARLAARIPARESASATLRYPLLLELAGAEIKRGQATLSGLSGSLRGAYLSGRSGAWLEGTADLAVQRAAWEGKTLGSPSLRAVLSREGGRAAVGGSLLGGSLTGDVAYKASAPAEELPFHLAIKGLALARAAELLPPKGAISPRDGTVEARVDGSFSRKNGLACSFDVAGAGIAASGKGGKTLFSGAAVRLAGEIAGERLLLREARLTAGQGISLRAHGTVTKPLSPKREGRLVYSLPATSLNSMIDPFVNILPRFIQEATVAGALAVDGTLNLRDGRQLLDGALKLDNVMLEVASQNFKTNDINGMLPFSLDLSGDAPAIARNQSSYTRKNYPRLLEQLGRAPVGGQTITVGSTVFGSLSLGEMKLQISAGEGITKIVSLRSSLYQGTLLGSGFLEVKKGLRYRTDLLINGLSLKQFCATIPKIKDYISGRLDGVISLAGAGKDLTGLTGYGNLWVREGSGEKMLVSRTFLQKLAGKNLSGFFFRADRPFDQAEIIAVLEEGNLTFDTLDISNTNLFGVRDLSVSVAQAQNRIALDHLLSAIKQAAVRGQAASGAGSASAPAGEAPAEPVFKWQE